MARFGSPPSSPRPPVPPTVMTLIRVLLQFRVSEAYIVTLPPWPPAMVVELPASPWQALPVQVMGSVTFGWYDTGAGLPVVLRVTTLAPPERHTRTHEGEKCSHIMQACAKETASSTTGSDTISEGSDNSHDACTRKSVFVLV